MRLPIRRGPVLATALACVAGAAAGRASIPARPAGEARDLPRDRDLERIDAALGQWDVAEAARLVERLEGNGRDPGMLALVRARVRFLEGRYREALEELELAGSRTLGHGELAREVDEFRDFVAPLAELADRLVAERSAHFEIHFVEGPDRVLARRGLETLESCHAAMARDFDLKVKPPSPIRVEVFPDPASFEKASTLTRQEIETSGTIALCKFNRLMMLSPRTVLRGFPWRDTLCHEYVHYVLWRRNGPTVPIWLHEGIAKYQEVRWRSGEGSALSPSLERLLARAIRDKDLVEFDAMHPSFAKLPTPHQVGLASAEVLSVLRTILADGGYPRLNRMLDALKRGADWRRMFEIALDQPFDEFWRAWQRRVAAELAPEAEAGGTETPAKLVQLRGEGGGGEGDEGPRDGAAGKDGEAGSAGSRHLRLADLLRERRHDEAAALEYERALAEGLGPTPYLLNRLGLTWQAAGNPEEARKAFGRAEELEPEYAPTLTNLGLLERSRGRAVEAIGFLERAAGINPFDPRVHEALAELLGALGRTDEARQAAREGSVLGTQPAAPAAATTAPETEAGAR